jgi:hypothetical protein
VAGWDVAAGTAREDDGPGESLWDWISLAEGRTGILAYHVEGSAAMTAHLLYAVRAVVRAVALSSPAPRELVARSNAALARAAIPDRNAFVRCGLVIPGAEILEWTGAGRVPAGIIRREGTFEELPSHGPPMGMMDGFRYARESIPVGPGDVFIMLSRGSSGLFRGAADLVAQVQGRTAGEVVSTLHGAIRKAHQGQERDTSVVFARKH